MTAVSIGDYNAVAARLAATHDPAELALGGINLWPLLRLLLFYVHERRCQSAAAALAGAKNPMRRPAAPAPDEAWRIRPLGPVGALLERAQDGPRPDLLVVQIAGDLPVGPDGRARDRLFEGAQAAFGAADVAALVLDHAGLAPGRLAPGSRILTPRLAPARFGAPDLARFGAALAPRLALAEAALGGALLSAADMIAWAHRLFGLEPCFRAALEALAPRAVMLQSCLRLEHLALIAAARRLGLPVIDHQHGVFRAGTDIYLSWPAIPADQIDPTPSVFWFWSPHFARLAPPAPAHIRTVAGGDLTALAEGAWPPAPARRGRPDGRARKIVYLHQGSLAAYERAPRGALPALAAAAIMAAPPDWRWLIRLHPLHADRGAAIAREYAGRVAICPPDASLPAVLDEADAVLTGFSAAATAAHDRGLGVVLHHPVGAALYAETIAAGAMAHAETVPAILAALADPPRPGAPLAWREADRARAALAAVLSNGRTPSAPPHAA